MTQRTIGCVLVLFFANLLPSVIDFSFKHIIDDVDTSQVRLLLYFIPGTAYITTLSIRKYFFVALGSRIGLLLGSACISAACYLFWPLQRKEEDVVG